MDEKLSKSYLKNLRQEAKSVLQENEKPGKISSLGGFFSESARSVRFILSEKENLTFAFLQLIAIGLCYYLWIEILSWIPEDVWEQIGKSNRQHGGLIDLIVLGWGFVCVGIAAYPIGLFTSCICASFMLRFSGRQSTMLECLKVALHHSNTIWIFSWIDGWWTVKRILERLPKKNDRTSLSTKLLNELIYQAWKLVSLGFIPAIIGGRSIKEAGKDSLLMLKNRFINVAKLRFGYSAVCWIVGIFCYVSIIFFVVNVPSVLRVKGSTVYSFYMLIGLPMLLNLAIIMLLFRPLYLISACRIYTNFARDNNIRLNLPTSSPKIFSSVFAFILLCLLAGAIFFFRDELGISQILENAEYLHKL